MSSYQVFPNLDFFDNNSEAEALAKNSLGNALMKYYDNIGSFIRSTGRGASGNFDDNRSYFSFGESYPKTYEGTGLAKQYNYLKDSGQNILNNIREGVFRTSEPEPGYFETVRSAFGFDDKPEPEPGYFEQIRTALGFGSAPEPEPGYFEQIRTALGYEDTPQPGYFEQFRAGLSSMSGQPPEPTYTEPSYMEQIGSKLGDYGSSVADSASNVGYGIQNLLSGIPSYFLMTSDVDPNIPEGGMSVLESSNPFGDYISVLMEQPKSTALALRHTDMVPYGYQFESSLPTVTDSSYLSTILSYLENLGVSIPDLSSLGLDTLKDFIYNVSSYISGASSTFIDAVQSVLGQYMYIPVTSSLSVIFSYLGQASSFLPGIFGNILIMILYTFLIRLASDAIGSFVFNRPQKFEKTLEAFCDECCIRKRICKIVIQILEYFSEFKSNEYPGESYNVYHCVKQQKDKIFITDMNPQMTHIERNYNIDISDLKPCLIMFVLDWWCTLNPKYSIMDNFYYDDNEEFTCQKFRFLDDILDHIDISCINDLGFQYISEFICQIIKKYSKSIKEVDLYVNDNFTNFSFDLSKGIDNFDLYTYKRMRSLLKLL